MLPEGYNVMTANDTPDTELEQAILWRTLRELQGISASWEGTTHGTSPAYVDTSGSVQGKSASYESRVGGKSDTSASDEENSPRRQVSNSNSNSNSNSIGSNDNSNFDEVSGSGGLMPSPGSQLHNLGECRPCIFNCKKKCASGAECSFCHYAHAVPKRRGKKSRRRAMARKRRQGEAANDDEEGDGSDDQSDDEVHNESKA
jgi:hypothetical protein